MNKHLSIQDVFFVLMKITLTQILLMVIFVSLISAAPLSGQEILDKKVSLEVNDEEIKSVLNEIEKQIPVIFTYRPDLVHVSKRVSFKIKETSLRDVLNHLFSPGVEFFATGKEILLKPITSESPIREALEVVPSTFALSVRGKVVDETGQPLPGVNVLEKGTTQGTTTDAEGNFTLDVQNAESVLIFSFIGYATLEVQVGAQTNINVSLMPDIRSLDEIVVVGYGSQTKSDLTGSIAKANLEDFRNAPNTNVGQMLQGTVPGLNIGQVNSAGATPSIQIRGRNTISGNSDVLIILDGVPFYGSLSSINPADIESINVLKDASSAAVYGAQSANGVILITTKKGKTGKGPRISFSSSYTTQEPTVGLRPKKKDEYLNQVRDLYWDLSYNEDGTLNENFNVVQYVDNELKDGNGNLLDNNYDWWTAATSPGHIFDNQLSISGNSESFNYLFSFGHTNQSGYIINDKFKRKSVRINLESQTTDWLKIGVNSMGSFVNQDGREPGLRDIMVQSPFLVPFDESGDLIPFPFNTLDPNPFMTYYVEDYERHNYLFANFYTEIDFPFLKGLTYRLNFGNNYHVNKTYFASEYAGGQTGEASKTFDDYYDYTLDNILTYSNTFGQHGITATLLYGAIERENSWTRALSREFSDISLGYDNLAIGTTQLVNSNGWKESGVYQMLRLNYKFSNKYLFTGTLRRDGFSAFAANRKYGIFPSVALGWVLSEESFFQPDWVDFLKIRAGYGLSGNKAGRYSSIASLIARPAYVFGDGGSPIQGRELSTLENADLGWEKTAGANIGFEFSVLKDRLSGSAEYYHNTTTDLLYDVKIPNITGFDLITSNIGKIENRGIEILLNSTNVKAGDFKWQTTFSFSRNVNEVITLTGQDKDGDGREDDLITSNLFIGHSLDAIYDYEVNGIYQLSEREEGSIPPGYFPGTYRIVDQNPVEGQAYQITPTDDRTFIGRGDPAYRFGLLNKFTYKGFSLTVFLNSIQGGENGYLGNNTPRMTRSDNTIRWNTINSIDFWTPGNPGGKYPQSLSAPTIGGALYQDRSFVRLQDVSLSYRFNTALLNKLGIEDLNLFVSGKNLATWTNWEGWDPETGTGLIVGGRPVMKGYSVGMNVTF